MIGDSKPTLIDCRYWARAMEASRHPRGATYVAKPGPSNKLNRAQRRAKAKL